MPFIPVPNGAQAELIYSWQGQVVENTLWFEGTGDYSGAALGGLVDGLIGWWTDQMRPLQCSSLSLIAVRCTAMDSPTSPSVEIAPLTDNSGTVMTSSVYNNVSWTVTFKTAARGRSFRGRNYVPGIPIVQTEENSIVGSYATSIINAYNQLLLITYVGSNVLSVCSRRSEGEDRAEGVLTPVVSFGYADLYLDSQRRRLPGRGA